jgi:PPOX class probable FMN-dependent enzyme
MMPVMNEIPFNDPITTEAELRTVIGEPTAMTKRKGLKELDIHSRAFMMRSPFLLLGTCDANGKGDVSPRGDGPGFVHVLDNKRIVIPERPGNRRADSLRNIIQTGSVGMLFLIPGVEDIFRINGRAWLTRDPELLQKLEAMGKVPLIAIGVEVEECYFHCAKAIKRSKLWDPTSWQNPDELASGARIAYEQYHPEGVTLEDMERLFKESYATRLY